MIDRMIKTCGKSRARQDSPAPAPKDHAGADPQEDNTDVLNAVIGQAF
jgi:hypothetical protein